MHVEVSEKLFNEIFESWNCETNREVNETHEKVGFFNMRLNVDGFKIWNFASSKKWQYYIQDINA